MVKKPDKQKSATSEQVEKFRQAARQVETDDREETFDRTLKMVAKKPDGVPSKSKGKGE